MKAKRILVSLDGSRVAEAALPVALDLAGGAGATLLLLRVIEAPLPGPESAAARLDVTREAETYLDDVARRAREEGARNVTVALWQGSPSQAIVTAADQYQVDLIVMTTHGRTGLQRDCFGSVAESVLRGTGRPVLVVRESATACETPRGHAAQLSVRGSAA
ncbi:MAG TPA: universal stress protein [Methylomirabilota bacterium]|nr:universal stress protein [Methylomirabilota bacterium]